MRVLLNLPGPHCLQNEGRYKKYLANRYGMGISQSEWMEASSEAPAAVHRPEREWMLACFSDTTWVPSVVYLRAGEMGFTRARRRLVRVHVCV